VRGVASYRETEPLTRFVARVRSQLTTLSHKGRGFLADGATHPRQPFPQFKERYEAT
jgi:hypothetical protein